MYIYMCVNRRLSHASRLCCGVLYIFAQMSTPPARDVRVCMKAKTVHANTFPLLHRGALITHTRVVSACGHRHECRHIRARARARTFIHTRTHARTRARARARAHTRIHTHTHTHTHVCIHTHTRSQKHMNTLSLARTRSLSLSPSPTHAAHTLQTTRTWRGPCSNISYMSSYVARDT